MSMRSEAIRHDVNRLAAGIVTYLCIMLAAGVVQIAVALLPLVMEYGFGAVPAEVLNPVLDGLSASGGAELGAVAVGLAFLVLFWRGLAHAPLFERGRSMDAKRFVVLVCLVMALQYVFMAVDGGLESLLNLFGLTLSAENAAATATSSTVTMFLYASLLGPIFEEIVFRGFALKTLQAHGRLFAIVVSSVLFALYHGNFVQMPYTFLAGLIFAYVASEYSLYWSMALHIINNCVFGDVLQYAFAAMDEGVAYGISFALMVLFVSVSVYTLVTKRTAIAEFIRQRRTETGSYRAAFTSIGFIVLCVCGISLACLGVRAL